MQMSSFLPACIIVPLYPYFLVIIFHINYSMVSGIYSNLGYLSIVSVEIENRINFLWKKHSLPGSLAKGELCKVF